MNYTPSNYLRSSSEADSGSSEEGAEEVKNVLGSFVLGGLIREPSVQLPLLDYALYKPVETLQAQ